MKMAFMPFPDTVDHKKMKSQQGLFYVARACDELYQCFLQCQNDHVPFPQDLDEAWGLLWLHLGRDPKMRERIKGSA